MMGTQQKRIAKNDKKILEDIRLSLIDLAKTEFDENKSKYLKRLNYVRDVFGDSTNYIAMWSPTIIPKIESKKKIKRKGIHAKSGSSRLKSSKNYKKPYKGQGK